MTRGNERRREHRRGRRPTSGSRTRCNRRQRRKDRSAAYPDVKLCRATDWCRIQRPDRQCLQHSALKPVRHRKQHRTMG
ncbi:MAG: hypothetical protein ACK559_33190, partial [bacterium]